MRANAQAVSTDETFALSRLAPCGLRPMTRARVAGSNVSLPPELERALAMASPTSVDPDALHDTAPDGRADPNDTSGPSDPSGPIAIAALEGWPHGGPSSSGAATPRPVAAADPRGDERRVAIRHRLRGLAVRVTLHGPASPTEPRGQLEARGRVRDISDRGGVFVEVRAGWPVGTRVRAAATLPTGHALNLVGRVVRVAPDGVGVRFDLDPTQSGLFVAFVERARRGDAPRGLSIQLVRVEGGPSDPDVDAELALRWRALCEAWDDDARHEAFVERCLRVGRVDLAIDRYRAAKRARPDDASVDRRLEHLGKVLAFAAFTRTPGAPTPGARRWIAPLALVGGAVIAFGVLWALVAR